MMRVLRRYPRATSHPLPLITWMPLVQFSRQKPLRATLVLRRLVAVHREHRLLRPALSRCHMHNVLSPSLNYHLTAQSECKHCVHENMTVSDVTITTSVANIIKWNDVKLVTAPTRLDSKFSCTVAETSSCSWPCPSFVMNPNETQPFWQPPLICCGQP